MSPCAHHVCATGWSITPLHHAPSPPFMALSLVHESCHVKSWAHESHDFSFVPQKSVVTITSTHGHMASVWWHKSVTSLSHCMHESQVHTPLITSPCTLPCGTRRDSQLPCSCIMPRQHMGASLHFHDTEARRAVSSSWLVGALGGRFKGSRGSLLVHERWVRVGPVRGRLIFVVYLTAVATRHKRHMSYRPSRLCSSCKWHASTLYAGRACA